MRSIPDEVPNFYKEVIQDPTILLNVKITAKQLSKIHDEFIKIYDNIPNVVRLDKEKGFFNDVIIVSDIHGSFESLSKIIKPFLEEKVKSMIFLGDYVDRGEHSIEVLVLLLILTITWPDRVLLLRGNHEELRVNRAFGFYYDLRDYFQFEKKEIKNLPENKILKKIGEYSNTLLTNVYDSASEFAQKRLFKNIEQIYNHLSIAAITPQKSFCVHAGIPREEIMLEEIDEIPKPHNILADFKHLKIFRALLWNDPTEKERDEDEVSYHDAEYFTEDQLAVFLQNNSLKRMIRGHESIRGAFESLFNGKLNHLFSVEPYFGRIKTAYVIHETKVDGKFITYLRDLDFNLIKKI